MGILRLENRLKKKQFIITRRKPHKVQCLVRLAGDYENLGQGPGASKMAHLGECLQCKHGAPSVYLQKPPESRHSGTYL